MYSVHVEGWLAGGVSYFGGIDMQVATRVDVKETGTSPIGAMKSWVWCIFQFCTIHLVQSGVMWDDDCHMLV